MIEDEGNKNYNSLDYNLVMDKILEYNDESFSKRYNMSPVFKLKEQNTSEEKGVVHDEMANKNNVFIFGMNNSINFSNDTRNILDWKPLDEYSAEYNENGEDILKEVNAKYTPGKNFQCKINSCKKVYTSSYGLKYHMDHGHTFEKITEKRPYLCPVKGCGRTYKNNNGLKYHISHVHKYFINEKENTN